RLMRVTSYRHQPGVSGSLSNDEVTVILIARDKTLWVGTQAGGLNRDAGGRGVFEHFRRDRGNAKSIASDHVTSLLEDSAGVLWVTTKGGGLSRFHPESRTFSAYRHRAADPGTITSSWATAMLEDSKGTMWVGTEDAGLNILDRATGKFTAPDLGFPEPLNIVSLVEDPLSPGVIWIATQRHGLLRYDPSTKAVIRYNMRNSLLPSDTVYSVLADEQSSIWAGTNKGLVRIGLKPDSLRIFGMDQGLQSMEFNTRACFRAKDGELLLGGVGGLNTFFPKAISQNNLPARVVITQVRTLNRGGQSSAGPHRVLFRNDGSPPAGALESDQRDLIFDFVALHFADPARNAYRFRLEGFDDDWRDAGASREVTYTNLPPGRYTFRVKAVTSRGVWSEEDATYRFTIAKPYYRTPWFILLAAASLVAAGFSA
ncbi:MAG: two-component regulator propeller domain-containing protein, partial [Desulfobacterales bacterium]|nr:two-component regulator propeller domain-containing protein [Desulfobacterales bacterium]